MHEFSIATDIAGTLSEFAAAHPDKEILKVHLQIGELTCVSAQQLQFCYESIITEAGLQKSVLEIEIIPAAVRCECCGYEGPSHRWDDALTVSVPTLQCPRCGQLAVATAGHECAIKSIQFLRREIAGVL